MDRQRRTPLSNRKILFLPISHDSKTSIHFFSFIYLFIFLQPCSFPLNFCIFFPFLAVLGQKEHFSKSVNFFFLHTKKQNKTTSFCLLYFWMFTPSLFGHWSKKSFPPKPPTFSFFFFFFLLFWIVYAVLNTSATRLKTFFAPKTILSDLPARRRGFDADKRPCHCFGRFYNETRETLTCISVGLFGWVMDLLYITYWLSDVLMLACTGGTLVHEAVNDRALPVSIWRRSWGRDQTNEEEKQFPTENFWCFLVIFRTITTNNLHCKIWKTSETT